MTKKMVLWLLAAILMVNGFSLEVLAVGSGDGRESKVSEDFETWVNPLYEGVINSDAPTEEIELQEDCARSGASDYVSVAKAASYMCDQMVNRSSVITVRVQTNIANLSSLVSTVFEKAVAVDRNTPGYKGDYIFYHVGGYQVRVSYVRVGSYTLTYTVNYLSTKAQEAKVTAKVNSLLSSLGVKSMTTYGKIKTIYDYICKNVSYDQAGLNDSSVGKFTAYNALFNKKAVCQGYASLFYRMAVDAGVLARVVPGSSRMESHAWNIVKLGNYYYNLDSTWDAGKKTYVYFLKNDRDFLDHVRDMEYQTGTFQKAYPIAPASYKTSASAALYTISSAKVSGIKNKTYTGKKRTQKVSLKIGKVTLKKGRDYKVTYKNNVKAGTASIIFTGKGNYSGKLKKTFKIVLKKGSIYKVKSCRYRIINNGSNGKRTVRLVGTVNSKISLANIPDTVKIGGQKFKVASVSKKVLKET